MFEPSYLRQHRRPHRKFSLTAVNIWICQFIFSVCLNICIRDANEGGWGFLTAGGTLQ